MKTAKYSIILIFGMMMATVFGISSPATAAPEALTDFEIVLPWGLDTDRGKIIESMIDNSTIANDYNFIYTQVGGGPSDRDALVARFLAGDYPNLILATQDWYTEWAQFNIWYDFAPNVTAWTGETGHETWRTDIPDGWWSILDQVNGDGTGTGIYALPWFGQSVLPYINLQHFADAGLTEANVTTIEGMLASAAALKAVGHTPFAQVGLLQSDIAYMNYMLGSTDNFIDSRTNPATVFSWDAEDKYGVNGSLSVEGFSAYLKLKGEGYSQSTVDTDGGGEVNAIFKAGNASMVFVGPWGTNIFWDEANGLNSTAFKAVPMFKSSDGTISTITGGGISWVPTVGQNATELADAVYLAEWLLEDENQMKTVDNWLNNSWRIPVRESLKNNAWFTEVGHPERANHVVHIESQVYAFAWGKQHPSWLSVHESVMMPGYKNALLAVNYGQGYTDAWYTEQAQAALDQMAADIQCFTLGGPCVDVGEDSTVVSTVTGPGGTSVITSVSTSISTKVTDGFTTAAIIISLATVAVIIGNRRRK